MNYQDIIATITLLGIGAVLPKLFEFFIDRQKTRDSSKHEFKQTRYKAILLLMYSLLDFEKHNKMLLKNKRDFKDSSELIDELKTEWTNMTLYAGDEVIKTMKHFLKDSTIDTYNSTALSMRKDLYNIKTSLTVEDLKLE